MRTKNLFLPVAMLTAMALSACGDDTAPVAADVAEYEKTGRAPALSFAGSPTALAAGASSTLNWTATGASSCAASGAWSGTMATSGSRGVTPASSVTYSLTCRNSRGRTTKSVSITVAPVVTPPPAPTPPPPSPTPPPPAPTPPPPTSSATLAKVLNFAETWARNWNFDGHVVDSRFTSGYGFWEYNDTTSEPWLFDRATVGYRLYELTGNTRWRDQFLSDFAWYRARIDAQGIFTPKGSGDTKYSYVTPFLIYEKITGDTQYRPVAKRIYDAWVADFPDNFNPNAALWTEREIGLALEAAVSYYELTGDAAALTRARALVNQWNVASGSAGAPQVSYTRHEGGGPGGTTPTSLTNSPWMSALYFQAARRLHALTNDSEPLAQASRYFNWLDTNGFYDASLAGAEYAGMVFPRYLTGELIGDAGYDAGNMGHCLDVAGMLRFVQAAKAARGESTARVELRAAQMAACAEADFAEWTRTTTYLPKYRVSPPRKTNWMIRGMYELTR